MASGVGSAKTNATNEPTIMGVQVTTSLYNTAIPLLIGKRRCSSHVIWYGYFGQSGGSGKKGKSSKKTGVTTYQANLDLLTGYGPVWNTQSTWNNSNLSAYGYTLNPPFTGMGVEQFSINGSTATGSINPGGGNNCDFISAISFTPTTPLSVTVEDYGDPQGSHSITEAGLAPAWDSGTAYQAGQIVSFTLTNVIRNVAFNWQCVNANTNVTPGSDAGEYWMPTVNESEQWLYNTYDNYSNSGAGAVAWRPGNWEFGQTLCNNASCTFAIGTDHGDANWSVTFPQPETGTITVYFGYTEANHDNPLSFIAYEFEPVLGSGNEYSGPQSGQQILYPELSGFGGVEVDLGASGTAPELDVEVQGLYSLTKSGQANPADMILDLILSGNIYFGSGLSTSDFTPLCFSHGLNFGGDPTRINQLGGAGNAGSVTWPPIVSFPYVLPMAGGAGNSTGSAFQILRDPPAFDRGVFNSDNIYNVNAIVQGSDGKFYRALCSNNSDPVSGGNAYWAPYTGIGTAQVVEEAFDATATNQGTGATNNSASLVPGHATDLAFFLPNIAGASPPSGWSEPSSGFYTKQLSSTAAITPIVSNSLYGSGIPVWANVTATVPTNGTPSIAHSTGWGSGGIGAGPHVLNAFDVVKGQAIVAMVQVDSFGQATQPLTLSDSIGTQYQVLSSTQVYDIGGNPENPYTVGAWLWIGFASETAPISVTMTLPSGVNDIEGSEVFAYDGLVASIPAPFSDGLTDVRNYCHANSIFGSFFLNSQRPAADILEELCKIANCVPVWNGQALDFYPLSEVSAIGGGYVYTPRTAPGPLVTLDYNYFAPSGSEAPVTVKQEKMQAVSNILDINYTDAGWDATGACGYQSYQSNSVRICDAEHCFLYGPMNGSPRGFDDYLTDSTTATSVGWPIMKRQRFADTYSVEFSLSQTIGSLLDPMDLITVIDPLFGGVLPTGVQTSASGQQDCRITSLTEDKGGAWSLSCERFMYGMSAPAAPSIANTVANVPPQQGALAGSVNAPYFFEPTAALAVALGMTAAGGICIAISGSATNYGGCVVNVSTDGGSSYNAIGKITGNPNMGVTITADYPSATSPDTTHTLYVNLTESDGELRSYTGGQQTQLIPIALLDNSGSPGAGNAAGYTTTVPYEIVTYQDTTLTAANEYSAAPPIFRGQLGSVPADHPISSVFVDLSNSTAVFKYSVPSGQIVGNLLYFKFQTLNLYSTGIQDISDCTAYTFSLTGTTNPTSPSSPAAGGSYIISPNPCLYQGRSGGWAGIDGSSTSWTNADDIYFPSTTVTYSSGTVTYTANDSGTTAFTDPDQTVYICIYDPSHAGGTPTVDIQSTNEHAVTPGYVFLGSITSASAPTTSGGTGGSSGTGGPQDTGGIQYLITINGEPAS
jgi:hypothetical protein